MSPPTTGRGVNLLLWSLQGILAAMFLAAGTMKAFLPEERLRAQESLAWIEDTGIEQARAAGFAELLAALGLILPGITGIAEVLTPLAALGLVVVMGLAARLHVSRGETQMAVVNTVIGLAALVVAVGRFVEPV